MGYYRDFLIQPKLILQSFCAEPLYSLTTSSWSYTFFISLSKQSTTYPEFITWFKTLFILYSRDKILVNFFFYSRFFFHFFQIFFHNLSTIPILFKNCFNEPVDGILSSVEKKSIINALVFISKTARTLLLIFFSKASFTTPYHLSAPLLKQIKIRYKF